MFEKVYRMCAKGDRIIVSKIKRKEADIGYYGQEVIVHLPKDLSVGENTIRFHLNDVNLEGNRTNHPAKEIILELDENRKSLLQEIISSAFSKHQPAKTWIEIGLRHEAYKYADQLFILLHLSTKESIFA